MKNTLRFLFFWGLLLLSAFSKNVVAGNYSAYLFAYFKGEGLAQGEQIYFAISRDGLHWTDLNEGRPVLTSSLGEKGLRDPFIMRSADGEKFYVIATDLKIYGNGNWTAAQTTGSKSVMIWESNDLVNWSDQRMCRVAPDGAGCTWAPEAIFNDETGEYLLFWSSKIPNSQNVPNNDNTHRVYYCTTKDFTSFSAPKVWIELKNASNRTISAIDATAIKVGDVYYRFIKNEATEAHKQGMPTTGKYIILQKSNSLLGNWVDVNSGISQISYMEGPTCFKMNDGNKWCVFLDDFGGKGYYPLISSDLSTGNFQQPNVSDYSLPSVMRHGSVINITEEELHNLLVKYDPSYQSAFAVNPSFRQQTIEGWGVSLCWWANMCGKWTDDKIDDLVKLLSSPEGLNYNIFRYNIGGGDDPSHINGHMTKGKGKRAEMDGFKPSEYAAYDWSADAGQRKVMLKLRDARKDAIFEAFSNSAPYWMTYSGCASGNTNAGSDNLKPAYYGMFCDYLIDVCKHYKQEYGIEFKTLEPFNEPNTTYWGANGGQEGCHFSPATQVDLLRVLYPKMQKSGLNTVISASDETSVQAAITGMQLFKKEGDIFPMLGQLNVHTYGGNPLEKANLRDLVEETKLPFWMSETGAGGTGIAGNLSLAQRMFDDLNYLLPQAWIDWQFVEENNDQWCMVQGNFSRQTYSIVKNYYVRMQVTRFIKQGYTLLSTGRSDVLAAISPNNDEVVLVFLNTGNTEKRMVADVSLLKGIKDPKLYVTNSSKNCQLSEGLEINDNRMLSYLMGPQEITTVVLSVDGYTGSKELKSDIPYLLYPRSASTVMQYTPTGPQLGFFSLASDAQKWYFQSVSNNKYVLYTEIGGKKLALTDDGSYFLTFADMNLSNIGQQFKIESIGNNCYKLISSGNDKLLDLEGNHTEADTRVGVWKAGETGENGHREWRIVPAPFSVITDDPTFAEPEANAAIILYTENQGITLSNPGALNIAVQVYDVKGILVQQIANSSSPILNFKVGKGVYVVRYVVNGESYSQKLEIR